MRIGIIGYGSMGKMLLNKFDEAGKDGLLVANRTPEKLLDLKPSIKVCSSNAELASEADIVFICVRPVDITGVLEEIRDVIKPETILVSLNGSVSFEAIGGLVRAKTAKVIPSVTSEINRSQTLVCFNDLMESSDKEVLKDLLTCVGDVIVLPESEMGMGSELVSCMPGFIASIFDVICNEARKHTSIPPEQIVSMVLNTMSATGDLMLQKDMTFGQVVERVATKGGITEEGTRVVYDRFPSVADELFLKTLAKRQLTAEKAALTMLKTPENPEK